MKKFKILLASLFAMFTLFSIQLFAENGTDKTVKNEFSSLQAPQDPVKPRAYYWVTVDYDGNRVSVDARNGSDTYVSQIKDGYSVQTKMPVARFDLYFDNQKLDENKKIGTYKIFQGSLLIVKTK